MRSDAPADLDRILRRCLAKDTDRRYQTAIDLRNDLEDLQQQRFASQTAAENAISIGTGRRRRWLVGLALIGAVAGIAAFLIWRQPAPPAPSSTLRATFSQLTHNPGIEWFPSLSPDGRWVVYAGDGAGNRDIYLQSVSGQTPINLTRDSTDDDDQPAFSPDGERIAFRSTREGGGLFVMGRTGEAVRRLTKIGFNPAWSRDGNQIAFTTIRTELRPQNTEGVSELWVVGVDGGEPRRLVESDAGLPNWSPRGQRIAFGVRRGGDVRRMDIVTIPVEGGAEQAVTLDAHLDWNPVWAPDGRHLYL